jgi:LPS-assembly lipoprotein
MSWSRRALLIAALALPACGFTPVHAPGGEGGALLGKVQADAPADTYGFAFVARIEDRLGRTEAPRWVLGYQLEFREIEVGVSSDNAITRYVVEGSAAWSLRPAVGGEPVLSGRVENFTAYSATGTTATTLSAQRDARERLMAALADDVVTRLYAEAGALPP